MLRLFFICFLLHICVLTKGQGGIVEVLVATVKMGDMQRYLQLDQRIWSSFLRRQDGFVSKRDLLATRQAIQNATEVYHLIEWASFEQWKKIPADQLMEINERFAKAFGYAPNLRALPDGDGFRVIEPDSSLID